MNGEGRKVKRGEKRQWRREEDTGWKGGHGGGVSEREGGLEEWEQSRRGWGGSGLPSAPSLVPLSPCCPNPTSLPRVVERASVEGVIDAEGLVAKALDTVKLVLSRHIPLMPLVL